MRVKQYAALIALAVAVPAASHAQIGGLIKRAANAAASKTEDKIVENNNLRPSSTFGPELTEESLDGVIRGLAAAQSKLQEAKDLRTARQKVDAEYSKSVDAHEKERQAYEDNRNRIGSCQDDARSKRRDEAQAAFERRVQSDPAGTSKLMQVAMEVSQKLNTAQAKGDTAEVRRMMTELAKAQGFDPQADSAAAIKQCGPLPARPAWLSEQESLRERSQSFDRQIRDAESGAHSSGAKASGMGIKEYSMARERVLHWYLEVRHGRKYQQFGPNERKLMEGRRGDIDKYSGAL